MHVCIRACTCALAKPAAVLVWLAFVREQPPSLPPAALAPGAAAAVAAVAAAAAAFCLLSYVQGVS